LIEATLDLERQLPWWGQDYELESCEGCESCDGFAVGIVARFSFGDLLNRQRDLQCMNLLWHLKHKQMAPSSTRSIFSASIDPVPTEASLSSKAFIGAGSFARDKVETAPRNMAHNFLDAINMYYSTAQS